jgi:hypothetical protein
MGIVEKCIWSDEVVSIDYNQSQLSEDLKKMVVQDIHPPLYYLVQRFLLFLFGYSPLSLRLFSLFCGSLAPLLLFFIGRRLSGFRGGAVASVLLALSPILVTWSQTARMYAPLVFLGLLCLLAWLKFENEEEHSNFLLYAALVLSWLTFYPFVFFIIALLGHSLVFSQKNHSRRLLKILFAVVITMTPLFLYLFMAKIGSQAAMAKFLNTEMAATTFHLLFETLRKFTIDTDVSFFHYLFPFLLLPIFLTLSDSQKERSGMRLSLVLAVVPAVLLFLTSKILVSLGHSPIYVHRALAFSLGPLLLWGGFLLTRIRSNLLLFFVLVATSAVLLFQNGVINVKYMDRGYQQDGEILKKLQKKGDALYLAPWFLDKEFQYYRQGVLPVLNFQAEDFGINNYLDVFNNEAFNKEELEQKFLAETNGRNRIWFFCKDLECNLGDGQMFSHDRLALNWFQENFRIMDHHITSFPNGQGRHDLYLFTRSKEADGPKERGLSVTVDIRDLIFCRLISLQPEVTLTLDKQEVIAIRGRDFDYQSEVLLSHYRFMDLKRFKEMESILKINKKNPHPAFPNISKLLAHIYNFSENWLLQDLNFLGSGPILSGQTDRKISTLHIRPAPVDDPVLRILIFLVGCFAFFTLFYQLILQFLLPARRQMRVKESREFS